MSPLLLSHLSSSPFFTLSATVAIISVSIALYPTLKYLTRRTPSPSTANSIPSPLTTLLPSLSLSQRADLPYPPDIFPGVRDVESPYGTLRVYEWGPEEGRKVLLVHGISTPCLSLGGVSEGLVEKGCRVMLIDLWGRGYSSTPLSQRHDGRLYATAMLIALASSPISWTGSSKFALIGYSLGGGIAANFTSYFPLLVSSLVLLAPAGLIREHHFSRLNLILYSTGFLPESILEWAIKRRLRKGPASASAVKPEEPAAAVEAELPEKPGFDGAVLSKRRPSVTVKDAVAWQVDYHQGFIKSFISSVHYGPISGQHNDWRRIGQRLSSHKSSSLEPRKNGEAGGLLKGQVLIISGKSDPVIIHDELVEDATKVLGVGNVQFETCDVGHELPITKAAEVVEMIWNFWGKKQ